MPRTMKKARSPPEITESARIKRAQNVADSPAAIVSAACSSPVDLRSSMMSSKSLALSVRAGAPSL